MYSLSTLNEGVNNTCHRVWTGTRNLSINKSVHVGWYTQQTIETSPLIRSVCGNKVATSSLTSSECVYATRCQSLAVGKSKLKVAKHQIPLHCHNRKVHTGLRGDGGYWEFLSLKAWSLPRVTGKGERAHYMTTSKNSMHSNDHIKGR